MPECALCGGGGGDGGAAPAQGCPSPRLGPSLPRDVAANLAAGTPCSCYMPECVLCLGGDVDATTKPLTGIVAANEVPRCRTPAVTKTWRKRGHWRPGHVGCTLAQELEEDKRIEAERLNDRIYRLAEVYILSLQPALSALELIGRQRGERWDFWEVFSGTGRFTAAVVVAGLMVGPPVDIIRFPGGLALDLLLQKSPGIVAGCIGGGSPTVVASWATMHVLDANQSLHSFQNAGNLGIASSKCEGAVVHSIADGIFAVSTGAEGIH